MYVLHGQAKVWGAWDPKAAVPEKKMPKLVQTVVATTAVAVDHKVCAANVLCTTYIHVCIPNNIPLVNV